MTFTVYSGAGNTFAIFDHPVTPQKVQSICTKHHLDGVIFSEKIFTMRIFNADGSEAEMCGNGLRCFVKYLLDKGIQQSKYCIETLAGQHIAWINQNQICVQFPPPSDLRLNLFIDSYLVHHLNTGVPHAVIFVDSVQEIDLKKLGPKIRYHPLFPQGANVNIVQFPLRVRTYERGVENETLACATGAVASSLIASYLFHLPSPLSITVQSGEKLKISFTSDWKNVMMEGPVEKLDTFSLV